MNIQKWATLVGLTFAFDINTSIKSIKKIHNLWNLNTDINYLQINIHIIILPLFYIYSKMYTEEIDPNYPNKTTLQFSRLRLRLGLKTW